MVILKNSFAHSVFLMGKRGGKYSPGYYKVNKLFYSALYAGFYFIYLFIFCAMLGLTCTRETKSRFIKGNVWAASKLKIFYVEGHHQESEKSTQRKGEDICKSFI